MTDDNAGPTPAEVAARVGGVLKSAASGVAGRLTRSATDVPVGTLWSSVAKPLTGGVGATRYRLDGAHLHFDRGALTTTTQSVPLVAIRDIKLKQSIAQKARGLYTIRIVVDRGIDQTTVKVEDIEDGREGHRAITDAAATARAAVWNSDQLSHLLQLQQLGKLRDSGVLTAEEFAAKKAEILSRI